MDIIDAVVFSFNSINFVTGLVLLFLVFKSIQALIQAYNDNESFAAMQQNPDKTGLSRFYYGVVMAMTSVIVFFLPYFFK